MKDNISTRLQEILENGRLVRPTMPYAYAPTMEPFAIFRMAFDDNGFTFVAGHDGKDIFKVGTRFPALRPIEVEFTEGVYKYYKDRGTKGKVIYWRRKPELTYNALTGLNMVYARLLLTDCLDESIEYWRDAALEPLLCPPKKSQEAQPLED